MENNFPLAYDLALWQAMRDDERKELMATAGWRLPSAVRPAVEGWPA